MVRKISLLLILAFFLVCSIPYLVGFYTKAKIEEEIDFINQDSKTSDMMQIYLSDYKLGWRYSVATVHITFSGMLAEALIKTTIQKNAPNDAALLQKFQGGKIRFAFEETIQHGPFIKHEGKWRLARSLSKGQLKLSDNAKAELKQAIGTSHLFETTTFVGFDNIADWHLISKPFSVKYNEHDTFVWKGLTANIKVTDDFKQLKAVWNAPGVEVQSKEGILNIDNIVYQSDLHQVFNGVWTGQANIAFNNLMMVNKIQNKQIQIQGGKFNANSSINNKLFNAATSGRIERFNLKNYQFGPFYYSMGLKKIDIMPFLSLEEKYTDLNPAQPPAQLMQDMNVLLPSFLRYNPEINIDNLFVRTPEGDMATNLKVIFNYPANENRFDPMLALAYLFADYRFALSDPLLQQILMQLFIETNKANPEYNKLTDYEKKSYQRDFVTFAKDFLLNEKLLMLANNTDYVFKIFLKNEKFLLNDVEVNPMALPEKLELLQNAATVKPKETPPTPQPLDLSGPRGSVTIPHQGVEPTKPGPAQPAAAP